MTITGPVTNDPNGITLDGNNALPVFVASQPVTLQYLTITQGTTNSSGGAGFRTSSNVTLNYCTVSNNSSSTGSGGVAGFGGGIYADGNIVLNHSTVSGNSAGNIGDNFVVTLNNSILSDNRSIVNDPNLFTTITSGSSITVNASHSVLGTGVQAQLSGNTNNLFTNAPQLGPLANNGGPTQTHALLANSPALDAADNAICANAPVSGLDQRGVTRGYNAAGAVNVPRTGDCDIGAFELPVDTLIIVKQTLPDNSPQTFDFSLDGGALNSPIADGGQIILNPAPGPHSLNETVPSGWDLTGIVCDDQSVQTNPAARPNLSFTLTGAGVTITCTFTNTQRGAVVFEKQTLPDGSPTAFSFSGAVNGNIGDGQQLSATLPPGNYTVSETVPADWDLTAIVCDDANSGILQGATASINLEAGETVTCTFTNRQRATLVIGLDAPGSAPATFDFTTVGLAPAAFALQEGQTQPFTGLIPGQSYVVDDQPPPPGWIFGEVICSAPPPACVPGSVTVTPTPGQTVTATFRFLRLSSGAESIPLFAPWGLGALIGVFGLLLARFQRR